MLCAAGFDDSDVELDPESAAAAAAAARAAAVANRAASRPGAGAGAGGGTDAFLSAMMKAEQRHNKQQQAAGAAADGDVLSRLLAAKDKQVCYACNAAECTQASITAGEDAFCIESELVTGALVRSMHIMCWVCTCSIRYLSKRPRQPTTHIDQCHPQVHAP